MRQNTTLTHTTAYTKILTKYSKCNLCTHNKHKLCFSQISDITTPITHIRTAFATKKTKIAPKAIKQLTLV